MRIGLLAAAVVTFGLPSAVRASELDPANADVPLTQLSSDPFTDPESQHATEVEPDTFAWGSTVVATFMDGRFYSGGGANGITWVTSQDAGATWAHGILPDMTKENGGPYDRVTDPAVAYDVRHDVWMISTSAIIFEPLDTFVLVNRSTDGGLTWSEPIVVRRISDNDKPWTVCDNGDVSPFKGNCYMQWNEYGANGVYHVLMSTSTDGGLSWGAPVTTPNVKGLVWAGQPLVQPDGTVVVTAMQGGRDNHIVAYRSADGGSTWSLQKKVATTHRHNSPGIRGGDDTLITAEIAGDGTIYVAWADCRFRINCGSNDIVYMRSPDGVKWSEVHRVPIDELKSGVDHFLPGLGVDRATSGSDTHLGLAYYRYPDADCDVSTCRLEAGFVSSIDGGNTWSSPLGLSGPMRPEWLAQTSRGAFIGDYISTSFTDDGIAHPVFPIARQPSDGVLDQAMYTPTDGLPVG